jgi:hypothetical protein
MDTRHGKLLTWDSLRRETVQEKYGTCSAIAYRSTGQIIGFESEEKHFHGILSNLLLLKSIISFKIATKHPF